MKRDRSDAARFQVGELVRITTTIMTSRSFQVGRVISVRISSRARTLDKYVIGFTDDAREFWDIQLEAVKISSPSETPSKSASAN
jgi:hypothetical protein